MSNRRIEQHGKLTKCFSYDVLVAVLDESDGKLYRNSQHWSATTTRHTNEFLRENPNRTIVDIPHEEMLSKFSGVVAQPEPNPDYVGEAASVSIFDLESRVIQEGQEPQSPQSNANQQTTSSSETLPPPF